MRTELDEMDDLDDMIVPLTRPRDAEIQAMSTEQRRAYYSAQSKKIRAKRIDEGLCASSRLHGPPEPGRTQCKRCRDKQREADRRRTAKKGRLL